MCQSRWVHFKTSSRTTRWFYSACVSCYRRPCLLSMIGVCSSECAVWGGRYWLVAGSRSCGSRGSRRLAGTSGVMFGSMATSDECFCWVLRPIQHGYTIQFQLGPHQFIVCTSPVNNQVHKAKNFFCFLYACKNSPRGDRKTALKKWQMNAR